MSEPLTVTIAITGNGKATGLQAVAQGVTGKDFALAPGGTCATETTYSAGDSCTVSVVFQPNGPGARIGAVVLKTDTALLGNTFLVGTGQGPLAVLEPGYIQTVVGSSTTEWIYNGDGGAADASPIFLPDGVVLDAGGNTFLADSSNNRVRKVDAQARTISTVAGNGIQGYSGTEVSATSTSVSLPGGLAIDGAGNLYFADTGNDIIRRVDAVTQIITTVAGTAGIRNYTGDNGPATSATLYAPASIAFDLAGNLYIADTNNHAVRVVDVKTGKIRTIAGTGVPGYNVDAKGDPMLATSARLNAPKGIAIGPDGSVFIADSANNRVRKIDLAGMISTIAGTDQQAFSGDNGSAELAALDAPAAITLDPAGNLYIADSANSVVRKINALTNIITTVTSEPNAVDSKGVPIPLGNTVLTLHGPNALFFDQITGDLLISDMFNNRIRRVSATAATLLYPAIRVSRTSSPQEETLNNDGNANLTFSTPTLVEAAIDADPIATTCTPGGSLAFGDSCLFGIDFAPTTINNVAELASVTLNSNASNNPNILTLSGPSLAVNPTSITLTSSKNPSVLGSSVTFTATVKNNDATAPTGTVTFLTETTVLCQDVQLPKDAVTVTCNTSALAPGSQTITANYSGDSENAASSSTLTQSALQATTLTLTAAPATDVIVGSAVLLSVKASATAGVVTFYDGKTILTTANLAAGIATYSAQLSAGTHTLVVTYAGDSTDAQGTSNSVVEDISQGTTQTMLATNNGNVNYGDTVTLTATVMMTPATAPTPTGQVQFLEGAAILGTGTIVNGVATFTIKTLAPGTHSIVASYDGDSSDAKSVSTPLSEVVQQIGTTVTLTSTLSTAKVGVAVPLTARVAIVAGAVADGPFTGQVTFHYGSTAISTLVDASGVATLNLTTLPVGNDSITATYEGDTNHSIYLSSTSAPLVEAITLASMTLTLSGPATVNLDTPATFTALATATNPTPTGQLVLLDGGTTIGKQPVGGPFTFVTSFLALGPHTLTVFYAGDANYSAATSNPVNVTVQQAPSTTSLLGSPNPQTVDQGVTLTAAVMSNNPGGPTMTGTVSFKDGAVSLGSGPLNAMGVAIVQLSSLSFGTHNLTAVYSGDTNYAESTSTVFTQKIVEPATIVLVPSANPIIGGSNVSFTAQLTGTATLTPTGIVTFFDGATPIGTGPISAGVASLSTNALSVGSHPITTSYAGDPNFSAATSTVLVEVVQNANSQIIVNTSANPSIYGTPLTLTAAIATNGAVATGPVTFTDAGTPIGTARPNSGGVASLMLSTLAPGPHTIVASYAGDGLTSASVSASFPLSVKELTSTAVVSSVNPALTLSAITLTASVTNSGVGVATGSVVFTDGATQLGTITLNAAGQAAITVPSLAVGNHPIVATYSGDVDNFPSGSASLAQGVQLRPTTTTLTTIASNASDSQQVTLISVVRWSGPTPPTGVVTFTNGSAVIGSTPIDATGVATLTVFVTSGSENVVATYNGDTAYAGSASMTTSVTGAPATQFTVTLNPPTVSVQTKQHGVVNITLTSVKGFSDTLEFGCLGLPFAATCTFSSTQMMLKPDGSQTIQLTIDTGNPLGAGAQASNAHSSGSNVLLGFLPGTLLIGFALARKKRSLPMLSIIALVFGMGAMLSITGCGGLQVNGTPAGTYTFKVAATGTQTGASTSQTMTLTVTQ